MSARPPSDTIEQMAPLLGSLARLVAGGTAVNEATLCTLLAGVDLPPHTGIIAEMALWAKLLHTLYDQSDLRLATSEALLMRCLPEASVLLAVSVVADKSRRHPDEPVQATSPAYTLQLGPDGSGDYRSLEEAVRLAPHGAVLHLAPGTYRLEQPLLLDKALSIMGPNIDQVAVVGTGEGMSCGVWGLVPL